MREIDGAVFLKQSDYRYARNSLWYRYVEPALDVLLSVLFWGSLAMIGAAILGAMFAFGAVGGLRLIGTLMFG